MYNFDFLRTILAHLRISFREEVGNVTVTKKLNAPFIPLPLFQKEGKRIVKAHPVAQETSQNSNLGTVQFNPSYATAQEPYPDFSVSRILPLIYV